MTEVEANPDPPTLARAARDTVSQPIDICGRCTWFRVFRQAPAVADKMGNCHWFPQARQVEASWWCAQFKRIAP